MPILRYFVVAGLALCGCLFAADSLIPKTQTAPVVQSRTEDSLANWRASEARKSSAVRRDDANSFATRSAS